MFTATLLWAKKQYGIFRWTKNSDLLSGRRRTSFTAILLSQGKDIHPCLESNCKQLLLKEQTALQYPCTARVRGIQMIECGSAPRLAARAGYDRWAEPPLINNTLVALLHNPRPPLLSQQFTSETRCHCWTSTRYRKFSHRPLLTTE
jgi:hypothetical protein